MSWSGLIALSLALYNPFAKLECRQRISPAQFLYFEVQPITLNGEHALEIDLFQNDELIYQKTAQLSAATEKDELFFKNPEVTITVLPKKDHQSKLLLINDPAIQNPITADCTYEVPIED